MGAIYYIPNILGYGRIVLAAPAWYAAVTGSHMALAAIIAFCLVSDFLDGFVARLLGIASSAGAKLDSTADNILIVSALPWTWFVAPDLFRQHLLATAGLGLLMAAVFSVMLVKHRRVVEIHTNAAKLGVTTMWIFLIHACMFGYSSVLGALFLLTSYLYLGEDLILLVLRRDLDEHERGFLFPRLIAAGRRRQ